ncbi:MAG TPA: PepSY-associated TM helix domain-containing protein, partial [Planctomycetota bacterium]|nr:PepSY-associated TM helix domain-containing protein [Planctomycetota bacterium]
MISARHPGWVSLIVGGNGSPKENGLLGCSINFGTPRQRLNVVQMKLDLANGGIYEERGWENEDGPVRARAVARLGHTGELFGTVGQAIGLIACLAGCVLVYTGFALSWRRFVRPRDGRNSESVPRSETEPPPKT